MFENYGDTSCDFLRLRLPPHPAFGTPLPNGGSGVRGFVTIFSRVTGMASVRFSSISSITPAVVDGVALVGLNTFKNWLIGTVTPK
jgi:hypothetical protein